MKNRSFIVDSIENLVLKLSKPLDYTFIIISIVSLIGLIILKEWRLIGFCIIYPFVFRWIMTILFSLILLLNILIEKLYIKSHILGNIFGYIAIVILNLIIVASFYLSMNLIMFGFANYESSGGIDLLPYLTSAWIVTFLPLRFMSKATKDDSDNLFKLYVIFATLFLLLLPTSFLGLVSSIISTTILILIVFIILPIYFYKNDSDSFFFE
jgi:hypothetical protein